MLDQLRPVARAGQRLVVEVVLWVADHRRLVAAAVADEDVVAGAPLEAMKAKSSAPITGAVGSTLSSPTTAAAAAAASSVSAALLTVAG